MSKDLMYREGFYYRDKYNDLWLAIGGDSLVRVRDENYGAWFGGVGLELEP